MLPPAPDPAEVRDAASLVLLRRPPGRPVEVLMGQRGARAAFMPDKFVFPGGAVDADDFAYAPPPEVEPRTARRLAFASAPALARALVLAAVRELWEETGLRLGRPDPQARARAAAAPPAWRGFLAEGLVPDTGALRHVFRAVTPPGRPRRFDARFFVAEAVAVAGPVDGFALADGELRHLQWLDIAAARALALPFITEVVLSEIAALTDAPEVDRPVPFFAHAAEGAQFRML